jgi:hypothetical protein
MNLLDEQAMSCARDIQVGIKAKAICCPTNRGGLPLAEGLEQ